MKVVREVLRDLGQDGVPVQGGLCFVKRKFALGEGVSRPFGPSAAPAASSGAASDGQGSRSIVRQSNRSLAPWPQSCRGRVAASTSATFRHRGWTPALAAAGVAHRRIYDLRHMYATWSLTPGIDIFTLARRMARACK